MHPLIVIVVIVAVGLIITFTAMSYIMSFWQQVHDVYISMPLLRARIEEFGRGVPSLDFTVRNEGSASVKILEIRIRAGEGFYVNRTGWVVHPGETLRIQIDDWLREGNPDKIVVGNTYRVFIVVEGLGPFIYDVIAT